MKSFFTAIIIICVSGMIIVGYYALKGFYKKYRDQKIRKKLRDKSYQDEKIYLKRYFKFLLSEMAMGRIRWILVASRLHPFDSIEITYSSIRDEIEILNRGRELNGSEREHIMQLGASRYSRKDQLHVIRSSINSKILTDLVYFLLEVVHNQERTMNLKINISGG